MVGIIIKDDKRYNYTEEFLKEKKITIMSDFTSLNNIDFILLPFKEISKNGEVNVAETKLTLDDAFFNKIDKNTLIFSGLNNNYIAQMCNKYDLKYYAIMEYEEVSILNANPTSEGVIHYLISNREETIHDSKILVCGYGICGSNLAKKLKALGSDVFALVRNKEKADKAAQDNITPISIDKIKEHTFDVIVNTIPKEIFTKNILDTLNKQTLLIDISSKPYGFDLEYSKSINLNAVLLPGIPGQHAPISAGKILGNFIYNKLIYLKERYYVKW